MLGINVSLLLRQLLRVCDFRSVGARRGHLAVKVLLGRGHPWNRLDAAMNWVHRVHVWLHKLLLTERLSEQVIVLACAHESVPLRISHERLAHVRHSRVALTEVRVCIAVLASFWGEGAARVIVSEWSILLGIILC